MASCELLVGSEAFWARAERDILAARRRVFVQAMTFEGDSAGKGVAGAIQGSTANERRILVDDYSRHVINDRFLALPQAFWNMPLRAEAAATRKMFDDLVAAGVSVRVTNPIRGNVARYGIRNHKKLIVADDVSYIGGINFSDHNFAWRDLMVRIDDRTAADFFASDFEATWNGEAEAKQIQAGALRLFALDGRNNAKSFSGLLAAIAEARETIELVSAYPTFPFLQALGKAAARGVRVEIFSPLPNNKPIVRAYLADRAPPMGIRVHFLPEMIHLKGMLIDGGSLALGSTNFDFASFHASEEYLAIVGDPDLIREFRTEVLNPARAAALPEADYRSPRWHFAWSLLILGLGNLFVKLMRDSWRGAVDWL